MKEKEEAKEQVMVVKISPELHKILEERATKWGVSNAQYVRNAVLFEALTAGNAKAYKMLSGDVGKMIMQLINKVKASATCTD